MAILGASNPRAKAAAEIDKIKDEYKQKEGDASKNGASRGELVALEKQKAAKIKDIRDKLTAETNKSEQEGFDKAFKAEQEINQEKIKQQNILRESIATTSAQRIALLNDEADQIHAQAMATSDLVEKERLLTTETEKRAQATKEASNAADKDQKTIADIIKDQDDAKHAGDTEGQHLAWLKEKADQADKLRDLGTADASDQLQLNAIAAKADSELATAKGEAKKHLADLKTEEKSAASKLADDQAEAMGFHGQVSSLRKVGFGKAPGSSDAGKQLKAVQEQKAVLDKIHTAIADLNNKIGGVA